MRALDLFCGGGGVAEGLAAAGFRVHGIDLNPRCERYYPGTFVRGNVLDLVPSDLDGYDLIWASPPCQAYSRAALTHRRADNPRLIDSTRRLLRGHPWTCIENVTEAPLRRDLTLTGPMVGLTRIMRARIFELSWFVLQPEARPIGDRANAAVITKSLSHPHHYYRRVRQGLPGRLPVSEAMQVMGIRHRMPGYMIGEAIPPAMAAWIARSAIAAGLGEGGLGRMGRRISDRSTGVRIPPSHTPSMPLE